MDESSSSLAAATGFDWHLGNAPKLRAKLAVEPAECEQAFFIEPLIVAFDVHHSENEPRWQALGQTAAGRRVFLVFTMRGSLILILAARDMSRRERIYYDETETTTQNNSGLQE